MSVARDMGTQTAAKGETLLEVQNLVKHFPITGGLLGKQVAKVAAGAILR